MSACCRSSHPTYILHHGVIARSTVVADIEYGTASSIEGVTHGVGLIACPMHHSGGDMQYIIDLGKVSNGFRSSNVFAKRLAYHVAHLHELLHALHSILGVYSKFACLFGIVHKGKRGCSRVNFLYVVHKSRALVSTHACHFLHIGHLVAELQNVARLTLQMVYSLVEAKIDYHIVAESFNGFGHGGVDALHAVVELLDLLVYLLHLHGFAVILVLCWRHGLYLFAQNLISLFELCKGTLAKIAAFVLPPVYGGGLYLPLGFVYLRQSFGDV